MCVCVCVCVCVCAFISGIHISICMKLFLGVNICRSTNI